MKKTFIAEIGNNHFGSIELFKELVCAAVDSGADMVKSQVFDPAKLKGSMPSQFYYECSSVLSGIEELTEYAKGKGIPLFFSCFGDMFACFDVEQEFKKISASQSREIFNEKIKVKEWDIDRDNVFISIPDDINTLPMLNKAVVMHVSDYLTDNPKLERIDQLSLFYNTLLMRKKGMIGYSDHTTGIENCSLAIEKRNANFIEKHFTLKKSMEWKGQVFRDTVHGATPSEFKELTRRFK